MSEGVGGSSLDRELLALLETTRDKQGDLLKLLEGLSHKHNQHAYSRMLEVLTGVKVKEPLAEQSISEILRHREALASSLGRDPGLAVAAFDYFVNVRPRVRVPRMVEAESYIRMERWAATDALTGLVNRRHFRKAAAAELRRAQRYAQPASIIFLDLDDFKETNDRWGHADGDIVLKEAARLINGAVREVDLAARYGGEEFAVLLPETPKTGAVAVAERIRRRVQERFSGEMHGHTFGMTVSGGLATFDEDGRDVDDLLQKADDALYLAKSRGKNRIVAAGQERRRHLRFEVADTLLDAAGFLSGSAPGLVEGRNISGSGALIETDRSLPVGSSVRLQFRTLDGTNPLIMLNGKVVRGEELTTASGRRFCAGIAFEDLDPRDREALDRVLSRAARDSAEEA